MKFIQSKENWKEESKESAETDPQDNGKKGRSKKAPQTAQSVALRLISMRDHSSRELREKLSERGFSTEEIEETLEFLREKRFLNDLRYGRALIRYMAERRYYGAYKIKMELLQKLDREFVDDLLPDELEEYDFCALAKELLEKPQFRGKSREAMIRKLKTNGYGVKEIRFALADLQRDED